MKFKVFLIIILYLFCSCSLQKVAKLFPNRPDSDLINGAAFKSASPEFKQGWHDGCESGMASGSNVFYQMFYRTNAIDGYALANSPDYASAWGNGWWYCTRADAIKHTPIWRSMFTGYQ